MWKVALTVLAAVFAVGSGTLVGGLTDIDTNDEGARNALNFAVVQHNRRSNDMYISQVAQVIRVQSQVVAGVKYVITAKMAKTHCKKNSVDEVCEIQADAKPFVCTFEVWSRPWLNEIQLLRQNCKH
uniref:Cystatin C (amyloid angiopathy and cerebral hemorrhage) n=1 Tax=Amphilophus citrinellus TaxID=61819 RepID=A0A3Q0RJ71_AMPCI